MSLSLSNSWGFCLNSLTKKWKKLQKFHFSDKTHFFAIRGVFHKCCFTKKIYFCKRFKLRPVLSVKNTPSRFCFFTPLACQFLIFFHLLILGELRNLHAKINTFSMKIDREINFQSWKLFLLIFHSCYNFAIVHWGHIRRKNNPWDIFHS